MRTVNVPADTMDVFLQLARSNTSSNIETCGVLAGHLARNELYITHIITPQQHGTPDSCNTMHEEQIFDVQDQMQLITLGWIHVRCAARASCHVGNLTNLSVLLISLRHIQVRLLSCPPSTCTRTARTR